MANLDKFQKEAEHAIKNKSTGSHATKDARLATLRALIKVAKKRNWQIMGLRNKYLRLYIEERKEEGLKNNTLQNQAAHLRTIARLVGKGHKLSLSNAQLGILPRDRKGKKRPLLEEEKWARFAQIRFLDVRIGAFLQWLLGLRAKEVVMCGKSLNSWRKALLSGRAVHVVYGTKNGRQRFTSTPYPELCLMVLDKAIEVCNSRCKRYLIWCQTGKLKTAMNRYWRVMRKGGLTGEVSPHALRYTYAQEIGTLYGQLGLDDEECKSALALELGHGAGRTSFVENVYYQEKNRRLISSQEIVTATRQYMDNAVEKTRDLLNIKADYQVPRLGPLALARGVALALDLSDVPGGASITERLRRLDVLGDPLAVIGQHTDFTDLVEQVEEAAARTDRSRGGHAPYPTETMVRILMLKRLYNLSDDQVAYQLVDRMSYQRFCGLLDAAQIPDHTAIGRFENRISAAGAEVLLDGVTAQLRKQGFVAGGGPLSP